MAGRGTDIQLGGNPDFIADEALRARGLSPAETPEEYEAAWDDALEEAKDQVEAEHEQVVRPAGSTCSAPSGTRAAGSTTSCAAAPGARATRGSRGSTSPWATT